MARLLSDRRTLQFSSFYFARQIFDLSRNLIDQQLIKKFKHLQQVINCLLEDTEAFKNTANTWIRRKIAMINDSDVLVNYKASEIKKLAKDAGITISESRIRKLLYQMIRNR